MLAKLEGMGKETRAFLGELGGGECPGVVGAEFPGLQNSEAEGSLGPGQGRLCEAGGEAGICTSVWDVHGVGGRSKPLGRQGGRGDSRRWS